MLPAATTGPSTPVDAQIPVDHIVVLMQENRSFDSYLGHLARYEAAKGIHNTIESAPDDASNPAYPAGQPPPDGGLPASDGGASLHHYAHATELCFFDTAHRWRDAHFAYDDGRNDGFFFASNGHGTEGAKTQGIDAAHLEGDRALWWYDERDIPFAYELYSTFATADAYFSDVLGPTYPNRFYLYSGTSFGETSDLSPDLSGYPYPGSGTNPAMIFDELQLRGITWSLYAEGPSAATVVFGVSLQQRYGFDPTRTYPQFVADAQAGTLPAVAFVDADFSEQTTNGDDEHPPSEIEIGQHYVWQIVHALTTSPSWSRSVLFITYDEAGGIYDHVPPPRACVPDDTPPVLHGVDVSQPGRFDRYGFRVPFVVVSPYARRSYVSHAVYSQASILRFIEAKARVPALSARDANSDPFTDMFDWKSPPFLTPPDFAEPPVDEAAVARCATELTPKP